MFNQLSEKLSQTLAKLRSRGKIRPVDLQEAVREIKLALLAADVHFKVVQQLTSTIANRLEGSQNLPTLSVAQHFLGIVQEEMQQLFGAPVKLDYRRTLMLGLQGSGKTTSAAKLAFWLKRKHEQTMLVGLDVKRPAAIEQLKILADTSNLKCFTATDISSPIAVCKESISLANNYSLLFDSAGRTSVDTPLMQEIKSLVEIIKPTATLLVMDAMSGQKALEVAAAFAAITPIDAMILTKTEGDSRAGAAFSIRSQLGIPLAFLGTGEKIGDFEPLDAQRLINRILGMGDLTGLGEKIEAALRPQSLQAGVDNIDAVDIELPGNFKDFNLDDFLKMSKWLKRLGPLSGLMPMIPGFSKVSKGLDMDAAQDSMRHVTALVQSMTVSERRQPQLLDGSRRLRIAKGSGQKVETLNRFLKQFEAMRKMMKNSGNIAKLMK